MNGTGIFRLAALSAVAFLFHPASASADCSKPEWPNPQSLKQLNGEARIPFLNTFQARVHEFIVCQRDSLEKRARGLTPSQVRQLIVQDRAAEERALVETEQLLRCVSLARQEPEAGAVRAQCEGHIAAALEERRPPNPPWFKVLKSEQRTAFGGAWSFQTIDLGRPGHCDDAECDNMLGVEVTNMTPIALQCEVALTLSHPEEGPHRGEQTITLNPGDSLPAARARSRRSPEGIEPEVTCSPAMPRARAVAAPAACVLNWTPRTFRYGRSGGSWLGGTALVEFAVRQDFKPPEGVRIVQADTRDIGQRAQSLVESTSFSTNCAGQRFGVRVEYRAFPCYVCELEYGVVTVYRDVRVSP